MKFDPNDDRYIYDVISKNIKYYRMHNNSKYSSFGRMTQEKLAELCGLSHSLISNIVKFNNLLVLLYYIEYQGF